MGNIYHMLHIEIRRYDMKRVRLKLKEYLDGRGITRYALAKQTGLTYPLVDRYYKNQLYRYDAETLNRIITALDCDLTDILEVVENGEA